MFEISIEARLKAQHQVRLADGTLEDPHEHDWLIRVAVGRHRLDEQMWVCDFQLLQALVADVLKRLQGADLDKVLPANPTAECLAEYVARKIGPALPEQVRLCSVHVGESPGCVACYRPD